MPYAVIDRLTALIPARFRSNRPTVPVVRLSGAIGVSLPLRDGLTLASCTSALERAFATKGAKAVALVINSPGGSPVQSHLIVKRIRALASEKSLPVYAFLEDVAASGGYMLACAADEIYADPSSIIGSIGVITSGFGFTRLLDKVGIERRVHTAGDHKAMLDPFQPENPDDIERLKEIQAEIHKAFIALVSERRGERLNDIAGDLFSGAFWVGNAVKERGLVDGFGDLRSILREKFGDKVDLRLTPGKKPPLLARLMGQGTALAMSDAGAVLATLEERALWGRFGL